MLYSRMMELQLKRYLSDISRIIEEEGDQKSGGKTKWRRTLSNLVLIIGEGAYKAAWHGETYLRRLSPKLDCTAGKVSK